MNFWYKNIDRVNAVRLVTNVWFFVAAFSIPTNIKNIYWSIDMDIRSMQADTLWPKCILYNLYSCSSSSSCFDHGCMCACFFYFSYLHIGMPIGKFSLSFFFFWFKFCEIYNRIRLCCLKCWCAVKVYLKTCND